MVLFMILWGVPHGSVVKNLSAMQGTQDAWVQSLGQENSPEGGNGNPLQYSCLGNLMDRGAWWAIVHRVAKSWTLLKQLSTHPYKSVAATATAKSLQSCPTLCDPIDGSPPGSPSLGFCRQEHWSGLPFPSLVHESEK